MNTGFLGPAVATVLTACGIETSFTCIGNRFTFNVATVLTACGIETVHNTYFMTFTIRLQQYLPLAVLKLTILI